mmetsp:Transcript_55903/g.90586  ORF Transcript_55903/g.90586 Transcript_55903/m.90586 type:complete len:118 (-) Transcript_55903:87-440(-)
MTRSITLLHLLFVDATGHMKANVALSLTHCIGSHPARSLKSTSLHYTKNEMMDQTDRSARVHLCRAALTVKARCSKPGVRQVAGYCDGNRQKYSNAFAAPTANSSLSQNAPRHLLGT